MLEAFSFKALQEGLNINKGLVEKGMSWDDVEAYLKTEVQRHRAFMDRAKTRTRPSARTISKKCPSCGRRMRLLPVSGHDKYRSKWACGAGCGSCNNGGGCGYVDFNEATIKEIIDQGGRI